MEKNKNFPIREDLTIGDSIVVIKDGKSFSGIFYAAETEIALLESNVIYYTRYTLICIGKNLKRFYVFKKTVDNKMFKIITDGDDLEIYYTKVVIFEKYKAQELKKRHMAWQ